MFHLYCPTCDKVSPVPSDTDAIILLCPVCNRRRDLRSGPVARAEPPAEAVQPTPSPRRPRPRSACPNGNRRRW